MKISDRMITTRGAPMPSFFFIFLFFIQMKRKWGHLGIKTNSDALLAYLVSHGGDMNEYNCERVTMKTLLQHKPILQSLLEIQSQIGYDNKFDTGHTI